MINQFGSVQFSRSVTSGLPVHQQLPEFTQTHLHWIGDAIQPSYPLSSPSPSDFNLSQHQGLFQWISSLHQVAKVLKFQFQHQSFQWYSGLLSLRMDWLNFLAVQATLKSLLQHYSWKASVLWCSDFLWFNSHIHTWLLENPRLRLDGPCQQHYGLVNFSTETNRIL